MARKSRANINETLTLDVPKIITIKTAIYARLSAENSHKDDDGNAIENQIAVCKEFIKENSEFSLADIYVDNGKKGTIFDRPEFNRLMSDIKSGYIKCLVVRDLSRFGRDYIETGTYLERIFPNIGLRFISVNERYDSFLSDKTNESLMIPLQNMINGIYAKDISRKVATSHRTRFLSGKFRRSTVPFGYKLDKTRTIVSIDEESAYYVRLIFKWRIDGKTIKEIINLLETNNVTNVKARKVQTSVHTGDIEKFKGWHSSTIQNMLKNHTYIGHTVIGKKIRAFYKGIVCEEIKDQSKWIFLENTHKAIISKEIFDKVQELNKISANHKKAKMEETAKKRALLTNLFKGKIFCADCGYPLSFNKIVDKNNFNATYKCSLYNRKKLCSLHSINYKKLNEKVLNAIATQVKVALDYEKLISKLKGSVGEVSIRDKQNYAISSFNLKINGIQKKRTKLYEDYVKGLLSAEDYIFAKESYDMQYNKLTLKLKDMIQRKLKFNEALSSDNKWLKLMKSISSAKELTQSLVDNSVDKVLLHKNGNIELTMMYSDIFAITRECVQEVKEVKI